MSLYDLTLPPTPPHLLLPVWQQAEDLEASAAAGARLLRAYKRVADRVHADSPHSLVRACRCVQTHASCLAMHTWFVGIGCPGSHPCTSGPPCRPTFFVDGDLVHLCVALWCWVAGSRSWCRRPTTDCSARRSTGRSGGSTTSKGLKAYICMHTYTHTPT